MGEDFLPEVYREMSISETIEEYQNKFLVPVIHSRDEIQWMIDFVRKTLKGIKFRHLQSLNKKDLGKIKEYRKERREQLDILRICEQNIKQDTNTLLNAIAGSTNYEWDKNLLTKIVGFETKGISSSDNLIPLPILSLLYTLSSRYCLLVKCAICAINLQYNVILFFESDPQKREESLEKKMKDFEAFCLHMQQNIKDIKKGQEEAQRQLAIQSDMSIRRLDTIENKVNKRNRADKRKTLTQEDCANMLFHQKVKYCKEREKYLQKVGIAKIQVMLPKDEKNVLRTIQRWDQYLANDGKEGTKPPKGYSREKSQMEFEIWAENVEKTKYLSWETKQTKIMRNQYISEGQVDTHFPEFNEDQKEEEDDFATRGKEDLVKGFKRLGIK